MLQSELKLMTDLERSVTHDHELKLGFLSAPTRKLHDKHHTMSRKESLEAV